MMAHLCIKDGNAGRVDGQDNRGTTGRIGNGAGAIVVVQTIHAL